MSFPIQNQQAGLHYGGDDMKNNTKNNWLMGITTTANIVDATSNYVTNKPVNLVGIIFFMVAIVYFLSYWTDNYEEE